MAPIFQIDSNYRETKSILRIFESQMYSTLTGGLPWQWFAINIPMDIFPGISKVKGDVDIIGSFLDVPSMINDNDPPTKYRVWEVKTVLVNNKNEAKSLKSGKTDGLMKQLTKLRKYGCPEVWFLEVYLLEDGYMNKNTFPSSQIMKSFKEKVDSLETKKYGYEIMPFEHYQTKDLDIGMKTIYNQFVPPKSSLTLLGPITTDVKHPFDLFVERLHQFYTDTINESNKREIEDIRKFGDAVITYCRNCKKLILIYPKISSACPECKLSIVDGSIRSNETKWEPIRHEEIELIERGGDSVEIPYEKKRLLKRLLGL
jgi:hypothetical protein